MNLILPNFHLHKNAVGSKIQLLEIGLSEKLIGFINCRK